MPRDIANGSAPQHFAVVGTGIAGMAAAWLLAKTHRVTVFETDGRIGGHSNTVDVAGRDGPMPVDTGFIVYNETTYPNLTQLFRHLGVPTKPSDMSFGVSLDDGALEYAGTDLAALFAQRRNLLRPRFWRMLNDIRRFYRTGPQLLSEPGAAALTLGDYLRRGGYSQAFINDHLLPMGAAIWSTATADMCAHPALAFVRFCMAHGLMRVSGRPQWRTVDGGSREYVRRLTASYADRVRLGTGVRTITRREDTVAITDTTGSTAIYDGVIVATHADQALRLLGDPSAEERRLLGAFRYSRNVAVLHGDTALMPRRRRVWSSWNYLRRRNRGTDTGAAPGVCVTYWMNRLQGLDPRVPVFVTLNPVDAPTAGSLIDRFVYEHPTYDRAAIAAQAALPSLQGVRRTWFCGSYFGAGFHEDALSAGLNAAEAAGGGVRPWHAPHLSTGQPVTASA